MRHRLQETNTTLLVGFGLLLVLMVALVAVASSGILTVRTELDRVVNEKLVKSQLAQTMFDASRERALLLMLMQYEEDPFERDEMMMQFRADAEKFMLAREKLFAMDLSREEQKALTDSVMYAASGAEAMNRLLELMVGDLEMDERSREEAATLMYERIIPARAKLGQRMLEIGWLVRESGEEIAADVEANYQQTKQLFWILGAAILLTSISIIWVVYQRVMRSSIQIHTMYDELDEIASHDSLTGLINRSSFEFQFQQMVERAQRYNEQLALLYLDLDGFKQINDTLGHAVGDQVLQSVSAVFSRQVRDNDIVGRIGGDEFAIVISHVGTEQRVGEIAERILREIKRPIELEGQPAVQIGISIGVALYPKDGRSEEELLQAADRAMYIAKQNGKGRIYFSEGGG